MSDIEERLREWALSVRRKPTPLDQAIPMVQEAANEIERLRAMIALHNDGSCKESELRPNPGDIRKESCTIQTVGELRKLIEDIPDDLLVVRHTDGCCEVNIVGIEAFVGELPMGDARPQQTDVMVVMQISA